MDSPNIKLTQFSHGAGCGCKISPQQLSVILETNNKSQHPLLLVGNDTRDDAAVFDLGDGTALISTTDFFTPIVDDAFDFGRIAAANSISDIYAMGGKPILAIAILGWPIEKLPAALAQEMMAGGRNICDEAQIPLAGGHSIDSLEPIFGLAVTGIVPLKNLKKNSTAEKGDLIFLTKSLGTGILSTAQKRGVIENEHKVVMTKSMVMLNRVGEKLGTFNGVTSMTDVTGFGLAGHLIEMMEGSNMSCKLFYNSIKKLDGVKQYIDQRIVPDATFRNWNSYSDKVKFEKGIDVMEAFTLLPDPQTNGGLLITVKREAINEIRDAFNDFSLDDYVEPIGEVVAKDDKIIYVMTASS